MKSTLQNLVFGLIFFIVGCDIAIRGTLRGFVFGQERYYVAVPLIMIGVYVLATVIARVISHRVK